jgi:hypothetical protein
MNHLSHLYHLLHHFFYNYLIDENNARRLLLRNVATRTEECRIEDIEDSSIDTDEQETLEEQRDIDI